MKNIASAIQMKALPHSTLVALLVSAVVINCSFDSESDAPTMNPTLTTSSALARNTAPTVDSDALRLLVQGNTGFALRVYQQLAQSGENLVFSPYSISLALAMTYGGARNTTADEMETTLGWSALGDSVHGVFNALDQFLQKPNPSSTSKAFTFRLANALWGQKDYSFLSTYLDQIAVNYGAGIRLLDFVGNPEESRLTINTWVSDSTNNKIKDLLPAGSITPLTRLVLTNAIYFYADWLDQFEAKDTREGRFFLATGDTVKVPFMSQSANLLHAETDLCQAVEIPYLGEDFSMVVMMPKGGSLSNFEKALDVAALREVLDSLKTPMCRSWRDSSVVEQCQVYLSLPKFKIEGAGISLARLLSTMGMPAAFTDADFSGIDGTQNLFISNVIHKAFIKVDEKGTEAAAATAVIMVQRGVGSRPIDFIVDKPFFFVIRHRATSTILFAGRIVNPS